MIQKWFDRTRGFAKQSKTTVAEQSPIVQIKEVCRSSVSIVHRVNASLTSPRSCLCPIVWSNEHKQVVWITILFVHRHHPIIRKRRQTSHLLPIPSSSTMEISTINYYESSSNEKQHRSRIPIKSASTSTSTCLSIFVDSRFRLDIGHSWENCAVKWRKISIPKRARIARFATMFTRNSWTTWHLSIDVRLLMMPSKENKWSCWSRANAFHLRSDLFSSLFGTNQLTSTETQRSSRVKDIRII